VKRAVVLVVTLLISVLAGNLFLVFAATPGYDLPAVSITHPKDGDIFRSSTVFLEFDVEPPTSYPEHYIHSVRYRIDEVRNVDFIYYNPNLTQTPLLRKFHGSLNLEGISDGVHTIRVLASFVDGGPYLEGFSPMVSFTVDASPPKVKVLSPEPMVYNVSSVPLVFTVSEPASGMVYCLDGGENVSVGGNASLAGLEGGRHSLVVFATDRVGNVGASEVRVFDVAGPSFPVTLVAVAVIVSVAAVSFGLVAYFLRRKKRSCET
jgi:hypothetical protein